MGKSSRVLSPLLSFIGGLFALAITAFSQTPTGSIVGTVLDETSSAVPNATITASRPSTVLRRTFTTDSYGAFSIAALPAGEYQVQAEAEGFSTLREVVIVQAGTTTRIDLRLQLGVLQQAVEAVASLPQIAYDRHGIAGVVSRFEIENLPLNGRELLQLSVLEPGVTVAPMAGFLTRQFDVSVVGASPSRTRVTVDAGPIFSPIAGGTPQGFSPEGIREFQISTVNFDLSTGLTGSGAINVVSRSGGNDYHGSAFYFFRDHNLAAYPALRREPAKADPFFARRQMGFSLGGPLKKDRLFFFTNFERTNQDGVFTIQPASSDFADFGGVFPTPFDSSQVSARFDLHLNDRNSLFLRYSHDGNDALTPPTGEGILPSNWSDTSNWADQSAAALTSTLQPNLINELRFAYWYWQTRNLIPDRSACPGECVGFGLPQVRILGVDFVMGNYFLAPEGGDFRRYHLTDTLSWHKGRHLWRFGLEWQFERGGGFLQFLEPAALVLYSPQTVRLFNSDPRVPPQARIPLPSSFDTAEDILDLPLVGFSTGFGDPSLPPPFNFDRARRTHIWRFYAHDTWRIRPRFTLNYGLSYSFDTNGVNHDLSKPEYLAPVLGTAGLEPTRRDRNNFGPSLGFAWNLSNNNKTVVRAGVGIYHELPLAANRLQERSTIGPRGSGRFAVDGSLLPNPIPGIPGVSVGQPLNFRDGPTHFTGRHLLSILPDFRRFLESQLGEPGNTDLSIRNIEVFKQGTGLLAHDFTRPYSGHINVGVQRELLPSMVLTADFVYRRFVHQNMGDVDLNRWNSVLGPVIPACSGLAVLNPAARCSTGPIGVQISGGRSRYRGLLIRLDRRFSRGYQLQASYALSSNQGFNGIINNDNWFESYGPTATDRRHIFTVSGIVDLPWSFRVSFLSTILSKPPFRAQMFGLDLNGDGTLNDSFPGVGWNQLNRGLDKDDLMRKVEEFNNSLAGGLTPRGQRIPVVTRMSPPYADRGCGQ